jgi:hypothetical protein
VNTIQTNRLLTPVAGAAIGFAAALAAIGTFVESGDDRARQFLVVLVIIAVAGVAVFGWLVPRRAADGSPWLALGLAIVGLASVAVFWSGLPPVLAAGGAFLGWAGRDTIRGAGLSRLAVAIGGLAVVADVVVYIGDATNLFG